METTTVKLTRQAFETVVYALRLWLDSPNSKKKKSISRWYGSNEEFALLDGEGIEKLIEQLSTTCVAPACIACGWDVTIGSKYCLQCSASGNSELPRCKDCGERLPLTTEEIFCGDACEEHYDYYNSERNENT